MKKTLTIAALAGLGITSAATFAWGGHGMWQGRWQGHGFGRTLSAEQRAQLQSMTPAQRRAYMQNLRASQWLSTQQNTTDIQQARQYQGQGMWRWQGQGMWQRGGQAWQAQQRMQENPATMINKYPVSNLTEELKEGLYNQYGEEKMAHDVYLYAYEKYGTPVFANIARSEQRHMDAIKALLDRYGITPPTDYAKDTELAEQLKAKVDEGLEQALNAGVTIEEVDIKDIAELAKQAYDAWAKDLVAVYTNIAGGSYNHLRGFLQSLKNYGYTLPDVSEYLPSGVTVDQLLQMRGPNAKKLFVEYVKKYYGIDLSSFQQQCKKNQTTVSSTATTVANQLASTTTNTVASTISSYVDKAKLNVFENYIKQKYAAKINSFFPEKIEEIISKINKVEEKIISSSVYDEQKKKVYITILEALKQILQEKLSSSSTNLIDNSLR